MRTMDMRWAAGLSRRLIAPSTTRGLAIGVLLFVLAKLLFVSFGAFSMSGPRIGDDSYVYLWFTRSNVFNELSRSPAVRSIEESAAAVATSTLTSQQEFAIDRVLLRVTGHGETFLNLVTAPIVGSEISFYLQFMLQEILVIVVMALGFWTLFKNLRRPPGLPFVLPLLALAFFPQQGIHFLIPSTLALSFGMIAWGLVLSERRRPVALGVAGTLAMLSHPIGIAHAGIGGLLVIWRLLRKDIGLSRAAAEAAVLLAVLLLFLLLAAGGVTASQKMSNVTSLGFADYFENLAGIYKRILVFWRSDPIAAIMAGAGIIAIFKSGSGFAAQRALVGIFASLMLVACTYSLAGYAGEVAIRFLVPVLILAFCHALFLLPEVAGSRSWPGLAYLVCAFVMAGHAIAFSLQNRDGRLPDIDRRELVLALERLDPGDHLAYLDTDMALQAALVAGAETHPTSVAPFLASNPQAAALLEENAPQFLVTVIPDELLLLRGLSRPLLTKTPYGFPLHRSRLALTVPGSARRLYVRQSESGGLLHVSVGGVECSVGAVNGKWRMIDLTDCVPARHLAAVKLDVSGEGSIAGLSLGEPRTRVNWPWGQAITWQHDRTDIWGDTVHHEGDFSFSALDPRLNLPVFQKYLPDLVPFDDASGIVFLEIDGHEG